jgi:hypothetical protein
MTITALKTVVGYYLGVGSPSIVSAVTSQLAGGWSPIGAPQLTDVYGQCAQTMIQSDLADVTAYLVVVGTDPSPPDATWEALAEVLWVDTTTWLQAYAKGMLYTSPTTLPDQVSGVLDILHGGTGAEDSETARNNLGITTLLAGKQPLDATLTALAALVGAVNTLPYFNGADTAALTALTPVGRDIVGSDTVADVRSYLELKSAALRDVGIGTNQIPDMNSFAFVLGTNGWFALPGGYIVQFGVGSFGNPSATSYSQTYSLPRSYPLAHIATIVVGNTTAMSSGATNVVMAVTQKTLSGFTLRADTNSAAIMNQNQTFNFISIGR